MKLKELIREAFAFTVLVCSIPFVIVMLCVAWIIPSDEEQARMSYEDKE